MSRTKRKMNMRAQSKAVAAVLSLALCLSMVVAGPTDAFYNDTDQSPNNVFVAGVLDISLNPDGTYSSPVLYPGDSASTTLAVPNEGTLAYDYSAQIQPIGADTSSCDFVSVSAITGASGMSTGHLAGFVLSTTSSATGTSTEYSFSLASDTPPSAWGKTCFFKWKYYAWQDGVDDPVHGWSDVAERLGSVRIGKAVVLNEFIPDPTGSDTAAKPLGEWVELYNNSNRNFDLAGWVLYDNTDTHELYITSGNTDTGGTVIVPHGFLVVYRDGDSDFNLNNDADSVRLATGYPIASSVTVDEYSYDTAKPEGFSFARIPDGVGAWVDPVPTPGKSNTEAVATTTENSPLVTANVDGAVDMSNIAGDIFSTMTSPEATTTDEVTDSTTTDDSVSASASSTPVNTDILISSDATTTATTTEVTTTEDISDTPATTTPDGAGVPDNSLGEASITPAVVTTDTTPADTGAPTTDTAPVPETPIAEPEPVVEPTVIEESAPLLPEPLPVILSEPALPPPPPPEPVSSVEPDQPSS